VNPALRAQVLREWGRHAAADAAVAAWPAMCDLVPSVVKKLGLEKRLHESQVCTLWPTIVGADIARHAQPLGLRNGTLLVVVDHPIWLQELARHHKDLILRRIRETVGPNVVRNICFRIG
jgi:predicted nucleic acid-binding Zn ribbon protein